MAALTDFDTFEPALNDAIFPEVLDAAFPMPDASFAWFADMPAHADAGMSTDHGASAQTMLAMPSNAMPLTPYSDGQASSTFSPMPVPQMPMSPAQQQSQLEDEPPYFNMQLHHTMSTVEMMQGALSHPSLMLSSATMAYVNMDADIPLAALVPAPLLRPPMMPVMELSDGDWGVDANASPLLPNLLWSFGSADSPAEELTMSPELPAGTSVTPTQQETLVVAQEQTIPTDDVYHNATNLRRADRGRSTHIAQHYPNVEEEVPLPVHPTSTQEQLFLHQAMMILTSIACHLQTCHAQSCQPTFDPMMHFSYRFQTNVTQIMV